MDIDVFFITQVWAYIEHLTSYEYLNHRRQCRQYTYLITHLTAYPSGVGEACCRGCFRRGHYGDLVLGVQVLDAAQNSRGWRSSLLVMPSENQLAWYKVVWISNTMNGSREV